MTPASWRFRRDAARARSVCVEDHLADAHDLGGDLDALVVAGELEALLERELARRGHRLERVGGGLTHVGQLLLLGDVHVHVVGARVLADDHALVDLLRSAATKNDMRSCSAIMANGVTTPERSATIEPLLRVDDVAGPRLVAVRDRVRDAGAARDR